ncbi:MAG: 3-phosphoshikimate 1-carboxyvinyltransferase [Chloroflexi bacterium]|nr:3-phosphoshikimate 1-carboxyvinyltransferase [Chloroflexota bacterium]
MIKTVAPIRALEGVVIPPGDKSISHRAAILGGISKGRTRVSNFSPGADCHSTVDCLKKMQVPIQDTADASGPGLLIEGVGLEGLTESHDILDAGNSGTTMRLLSGLLAGQSFLSILTGDDSLRYRPMARIIQPLRLMGATVWGRGGDTFAPLAIRGGSLKGIDYKLSVASAQVKSSIMLAALFARGQTTVHQPALSRDHTEQMLAAQGVSIKTEGLTVTLTPPTGPLPAQDIAVPGDLSSAAFWLVAGAAHPQARLQVKNCGLNPTRSGAITVLQNMGAKLTISNQRMEGTELVGDISVESSSLQGTEISGEIIPTLIDELPILAVAAVVARGKTVIRDAAELRVKESDRISGTVKGLAGLGVRIEELPDGMIIHGGGRFAGGECDSHKDHRMAMALGVAAILGQGETAIHNAQVVDISYPGFWQELERVSRP